MLQRILKTNDDIAATILRVTLGLVMIPHGTQKLFGWFGGAGFDGTVAFFSDALGIPPVVTVLVVAAEVLGGVALILGLFGRVAAVGVFAIMAGAVVTVHAQNGFFMNWAGTQGGEGFEYHLLAMAIAVAVFVNGSGRASLDALLARRVS